MTELDVTYRCNCRCRMCQRWQDSRKNEMALSEYRRLSEILNDLGTHQISIAGGEPLLREDVFDIIEEFSRRGMSVNLCTNGIGLQRYAEEICRCGASCVTVSIDGADPDTHDEMRGVRHSYQEIVNGIQILLKRPFSHRPVVRVRMTISHANMDQIGSFYCRWGRVADDVLFQPVHFCRDAYYTGPTDETYALDPETMSAQISGTPVGRDPYMRKLITSLHLSGAFPEQRCYAGILMVRIDPWGNVYPCLEQHTCVGSVRGADFEEVWYSDLFNRARRRLISGKTCRCWYNNTALIGHYGGLLKRISRFR